MSRENSGTPIRPIGRLTFGPNRTFTNKTAIMAVALAMLAGLLWSTSVVAKSKRPSGPMVSISGLVKHPLTLSLGDLAAMATVEVKHNAITQDGEFHGVFWLKGVPLRSLLAMAKVGKESGVFSKRIDTALVIRTKDGKQVVLSWGEVFYRNPGDVILAFAARPVRPHKSCAACHEPDVYQPWLSQLERQVGLPKLVLAKDFFSDRALEGVTSIEVVGLSPGQWGPKKKGKLHHPTFSLSGPGSSPVTYKKLPDLARSQILANHVGEGKGYHGRDIFIGVPLIELLKKQGIKGDLNSVLLISAPDGYRSLVSWGELFMSDLGRRILIADTKNGKPIDADGRFILVMPDDLWADRMVKATAKVEVVSLARSPKLYVIGVGCGDSALLTLKAVSLLTTVDALVAPADIQRRFAPYLTGKKVLYDPMAFAKKPFNATGKHAKAESRKLRNQRQAKGAELIKKALKEGKSVAVLDWGDPLIYGSWRWMKDFFPSEAITFIPGVSAFSAGASAVARDITCNGAIAISDPFSILAKPELVSALAAKGATLAVFMGMPKFGQVMGAVGKAYPPDTPVTVVVKAGFSNGERVTRTTLAKITSAQAKPKENWLGVIFVGPCLK